MEICVAIEECHWLIRIRVHLIVNLSEPIPGWGGDPLLSSGGDVQNKTSPNTLGSNRAWGGGAGSGFDPPLSPTIPACGSRDPSGARRGKG